MIYKFNVSPLLKEYELRRNPVIIRVNEFTEKSAKEFSQKIAMAHNTGQKVIPIIIDSYGGQVYSLMSMIAEIKSASLPIMRNCGQADDYFLEKLKENSRADMYLEAQQCVDDNLVQHLRIPSMNIKIDVKIDVK